MAGPVNGLGAQQQIPLANTFQPGQNEQVRTENSDDTDKLQGAAAPKTSKSEPTEEVSLQSSKQASNENEPAASKKRGSLLDITV